VWGLSATLFGEITIKDGRVEQSNFHDYPMVRLAGAPKVESIIMPSGGILGRRWRAASSARGARALQRDLCCNRQAHPRAPAEDRRLAEGIAAARASRISTELLARSDRLIAAVHEFALGH